MPGRGLGVGRIEPDRPPTTASPRCPARRPRRLLLRFRQVQHPLDVPQLLLQLPAVIGWRQLGAKGSGGRAGRLRSGPGVGPAGGSFGYVAAGGVRQYRCTAGARIIPRVPGADARHVLLALFTPHRVLSIGRPKGRLYRFRRFCGPGSHQTAKFFVPCFPVKKGCRSGHTACSGQ